VGQLRDKNDHGRTEPLRRGLPLAEGWNVTGRGEGGVLVNLDGTPVAVSPAEEDTDA